MENEKTTTTGAKGAWAKFRKHPMFIHLYATGWSIAAFAIVAWLLSISK